MQNNNLDILFQPFKLGELTLKNRFVVSATSRRRTDSKLVNPSFYPEHFALRASAGLIIGECVTVSNNGYSFPGCGAIFTQEQIDGWKQVTEAVHAKGGLIITQIWHAGRMANPKVMGEESWAPSAIAVRGDLFEGHPHQVPKEITKEEIKQVVELHRQAAINAKEAGFDGVQIHAANGYLLEGFIRDGTNKRTDDYGGSIENRARLILEVTDAILSVWSAGRVGIKFSPVSRMNDMYDSNPLAIYSYLMKEMEKRGIAHVEVVEPNSDSKKDGEWEDPKVQMPEVAKLLRPYYSGAIIVNNEQTPEKAAKTISEGSANLVSFCKNFIANPDYVERVRNDWPLNKLDFGTLFNGGEKGMNDYPLYVRK